MHWLSLLVYRSKGDNHPLSCVPVLSCGIRWSRRYRIASAWASAPSWSNQGPSSASTFRPRPGIIFSLLWAFGYFSCNSFHDTRNGLWNGWIYILICRRRRPEFANGWKAIIYLFIFILVFPSRFSLSLFLGWGSLYFCCLDASRPISP